MAETVILYLLQEYISRGVHYKAGTTIEVDRDTALFLQRDAPGCFAPISVGGKPVIKEADEEPKEVTIEKMFDAPPAHKMVKKPAKKK